MIPQTSSTEPYNLEWCLRKRFPSANLVQLLKQRELGSRREGSHFIVGSRQFYHSLLITRQEYFVHRPQFLPLRFTPDGSLLIAIGGSLQEIQLFTYRGVQFGANVPTEQLFQTVFPKCRVVTFWGPAENSRSSERLQFGFLSRDCAIVTPDSRFLTVSASIAVPETRSIFRLIQRNNESLSPDRNLMDTTFYSIDLRSAKVVDKYKFEFDQINIHSCVYQLEWTLAILSVQHQTIHMVAIDRHNGHYIPLMEIGHSMIENDALFLAKANPRTERTFTAFRQRFLTFLYKEHARNGQIQRFLLNIDFYRSMKMHKIQFAGPDLILIRVDPIPPDPVGGASTSSTAASGQGQYMFVLLEWRMGRILGVFPRNSEALLELFERHNESFKNGHLPRNMFPTSLEHCGHAREQHQYAKEVSLLTASASDVRRRLLALLPLPNTQHLVASPYLDPNLFSVEERLLNLIERGRYPPDQPLKLFSRHTKCLHSRMDLRTIAIKPYAWAWVLFHPSDPFVVSISRGIQPEQISFHMPTEAPQM